MKVFEGSSVRDCLRPRRLGPEGGTWGVLPLSEAPEELPQLLGVVDSGAALPLW